MSVAVSRQPPFNPITTHRRVPNQRAPSAPAAIAPGLIRIQGGTIRGSSSPQRTSRSRQRKQQNRQSQDGTPQPIPPSDPVRDSPQSNNGSAKTEPAPAPAPSPARKDRTSPKRGSQQPHGKQQPHQPHQHHQPKKQAVQKQSLPAASRHKSSPQSPTKARHQHARPPRQFDLHELSFSSADDSDDALAPVIPFSPTRPTAVPTALAGEPAGRLARARRDNSNGKGTTVGPVADTDNESDTIIPTPPASIPIARNGRSGHARAATTSDPFLSRSVPVSSLPDWDLPPPSFGTSSSGSSSDITAMVAADVPHPPLSTPQLSPAPATPERRSRRPAPLLKAAAMSEDRLLVPWIETLEDEEERSAALRASAPLVSRPGRTGIPDGPAPCTPTRPARRHTRTASVPSMSTVHGFSSSPATPTAHRRYGGSPASSTDQVNKYANGRFQSAPAPTFLPMPTFEA